MQHLYVGIRVGEDPVVLVTAGRRSFKALPTRTRYGAEPEARPDWGTDARGARELAWLLLFDVTGDRAVADRLNANYALSVVSGLRNRVWSLTRHEVIGWVLTYEGSGSHPTPASAPDDDDELIDLTGGTDAK